MGDATGRVGSRGMKSHFASFAPRVLSLHGKTVDERRLHDARRRRFFALALLRKDLQHANDSGTIEPYRGE